MTACFIETILELAEALQQDNRMQLVAVQDQGILYCLASVKWYDITGAVCEAASAANTLK